MKNILARGGIEFLAVFLGIALSLWVDEYQKSKESQKLNKQILKRLHDNLEADSTDAVWNAKAHKVASIGSKRGLDWCDIGQPDIDSKDIFISALAIRTIFINNIDDILEDKANFIEQDHSKATYASKIEKKEGNINWNDTAERIIGKINGLYPSPGAFFMFKGERYKILKAKIGNGIGNPGEIVSDYMEVICGNNQSIKVTEVQREGKKPQNIGEFMLGSLIKKGSKI